MILIDNRIGSKELKDVIVAPSELTRLDYGDAAFNGNGPDDQFYSIGVERKKIGDLISSIETGRLSGHQLIGLLNSYHYTYLIVEGYWTVDREGLICKGGSTRIQHGKRFYSAREVWGYLNNLAITCGVRVMSTQNLNCTGLLINTLYQWWQKKWSDHKAHTMFHVPPEKAFLTAPSTTQLMAKELSGVGWNKSVEIVKHYKSMEELVFATPKDLQIIDGIGKKLSKTIYFELHGREFKED